MQPLTFQPLLKRYLWGGRRLGTMLGKPLGEGDDYAESWELVDHPDGQSVVVGGPLAGATLGGLVRSHGPEVFGRHATVGGEPRTQFPLLFKLLDACRTLSVQVHPNDQQAAELSPPDLGKTEAWIVLAAEPGSKIYSGLRPGVDRRALADAIEAGACEACLHAFEPAPGDCVFIPAGTVHALGQGLVIAEIQQASNTTFRLFDWNRVGKDGQPRPLHVQQSLEVTDYDRGPVGPQQPDVVGPGVERLVACDKFVLDRRCLSGDDQPVGSDGQTVGGDDRFHILSAVAGGATLTCGDHETPLPLGATVLLPAAAGQAVLSAQTEQATGAAVLDMYLP